MEGGYRVGNLDKLDSRYKCEHCKLLLRDALQGDCGHRYCTVCVRAKERDAIEKGGFSFCDVCGEDEETKIIRDRTYPDNAIRREINKKLQLLCPNSPCEQQMLLKDLESHMEECEYRPVKCPDCNDQVPYCTLKQHSESDCPKRQVSCSKCGEFVAFDELKHHEAATCIGNTRKCDYCLARVRDSDEDMDAHLIKDCIVGWHKDRPCPYGCASIEGDWQKHRQQHHSLHIDRVLALACVTCHSAAIRCVLIKAAAAAAAAAPATKEKRPGLVTDSRVVAQPQQESDGAVVNESDVYSQLLQLQERVQAVDAVVGNADLKFLKDSREGKQYVKRIDDALGQSNQVQHLLVKLKEKLESYNERIKEYETRFKRDLEKKLDIEQKYQELLRLLAYKEVKILELERRIEIIESSSYDGVLVWKITDISRRKAEAREGKVCSIYSPPFYTGKAGYKMCGRLYLNGDGAGKNTHISLFFVIMRGQYDALMPWPFAKKVTMMLLDQKFEENVIDAFKPDTSSSSFKRPTTNMNIASGCPLFMPIADFENSERGYVKDDTMFIKFIVDKSDLPS